MTRYYNRQWQDLPDEQVDEDEDYLYFNTETPGFSIFSIVGDEYREVIKKSIAQEPQVEQQTEEDKPFEAESARTPGFTAMSALVLIAGASTLRKK